MSSLTALHDWRTARCRGSSKTLRSPVLPADGVPRLRRPDRNSCRLHLCLGGSALP